MTEPITGASMEAGTPVFPSSVLDDTVKLSKDFDAYYHSHEGLTKQELFRDWVFEKLASMMAAIKRQGAQR